MYKGITIESDAFEPDKRFLVTLTIQEKVKARTEEEAIKVVSNQVWHDKLGNLPGALINVILVE